MSKVISNKDTNLVWIDLEMTDLDFRKDRITEIACLVTNEQLEIIAEGPDIIINQPIELYNLSDPNIVEYFEKTGFIKKVEESTYTEQEAEDEVLKFIRNHVERGVSPLCGNSVFLDRIFINVYMEELNDYLHYRLIDVTTIKNLARRWYPDLPKYKKKDLHRGMDDIKESVAELRYYRDTLFRKRLA